VAVAVAVQEAMTK